MPRISNYERHTKAQLLWDAFETLKEESEKQGKLLVEMSKVVKLANEDERMREFTDPIGDKSVYSQAINSVYPPIVKAVNTYIENYKKEAKKANKRSKNKLKNIDAKLKSVEAIVIEQQEKIHVLIARLENKERIIVQTEKERDDYATEVYRLRKKYEYA
ncbi:MAG: hypothetical protein J7J31_03815 [Helicobacteraceae bacterium]|nr:hypothetical protein [Helicobacteraceae bacterium]